MEDRRKQIIEAGLALLREEGLPGLTQPRIAARTGLRQSHLTYYYPTRAALVAAVARAAVEAQSAGVRTMLARIPSLDEAAEVIAAGTARHENARVLLALCQAAEQEPEVCDLFNKLADNSIAQAMAFLDRLGLTPARADADLLHALFIGLSITHIAAARSDQQARSHAALDLAFQELAARTAREGEPDHRHPAPTGDQ